MFPDFRIRLHVNDTWTEPFEVIGIDVGTTHITAPPRWVSFDDTIVPACSTFNFGTQSVSYSARLQIGAFYDQMGMILNHAPARYLTFPVWVVSQGGSLLVACSTRLGTDVYL